VFRLPRQDNQYGKQIPLIQAKVAFKTTAWAARMEHPTITYVLAPKDGISSAATKVEGGYGLRLAPAQNDVALLHGANLFLRNV